MKTIRNLSGAFFVYDNPETKKQECLTFEDMPEEWQDKILKGLLKDELKSLVKLFADALNRVGDQFDIEAEFENKE